MVSSVLAHRVVRVHRPIQFLIADRFPRPGVNALGHRVHRNATVDRTDADAEIAADAFVVDDFEVTLAI
jgi:hypothetical protein